MSSTASTSATIIKRSEPSSTGGTSQLNNNYTKITPTCRCCPHGFHIDLGFVQFAQDVSNGFISRQGTPTHFKPNGSQNPDRSLMSPMESNFSDSLENIFSDFAEALAPHKVDREQFRSIPVRESVDIQNMKNRLQNGYSSDYTAYRRGSSTTSSSTLPTRPTQLSFNGSSSRSHTPTRPINGSTNGSSPYKTSLAKTAAELRARNSESPFPQEPSRTNTPIDLGLHQNPRHHLGGSVTPTRFYNNDLPPTPSPMFRRAPSQGDLPDLTGTSPGDFASLRRGRQIALPEVAPSPRVRFLSASPKTPRRLVFSTAKSVEQPDPTPFTYSHQKNGDVVLARNQSTLTSPSAFVPIDRPIVTRSVATTTGPLPPAKPCGECPTLRKELQIALESIPPPLPSPPMKTTIATSTETIQLEHTGCSPDPISIQNVGLDTNDLIQMVDAGIETVRLYGCLHVEIQTDDIVIEKSKPDVVDTASSPIIFEKNDECEECEKRLNTFTRNVGSGVCSINDRICVKCDEDIDEADENEAPGFVPPDVNEEDAIKKQQKNEDIAKAVKKLLTNEQKSNFQRGTAVSKSARYDRKKTVDNLDYIIDKNTKPVTTPSTTTTPTTESSDALKSKVVLKKESVQSQASAPIEQPAPPPAQLLEPIAARIPRPKISKWATPEEAAETPDEEEEAQDRLTPLRSELRPLGNRWIRNSANTVTSTQSSLPYPSSDDISDSDAESDCSANSDGTFEVIDDIDGTPSNFEPSDKLKEALENLNSSLLEAGSVPDETVEWSRKLVQHEWMKTAARKTSRYEHVDRFLEELSNLGPKIIHEVVNMSDQNGNTALHYVVSHANFAVVSSILDSGECELNKANMAGYTPVMLAALSSLEDDMEQAVVHRLFEMGDVNARASPHGQTALMLAVSHGKKLTTELLLQCNADVNLQDEEGSTALMCAAEHGHRDIVKLLLSQPSIDTNLTDCDSSTALTIAIENGHREIGVLIYAHQNYAQLDTYGPSTDI